MVVTEQNPMDIAFQSKEVRDMFQKMRVERDIELLTTGKGKEPLESARNLLENLKDREKHTGSKHPELKKELELFTEKAKQKAIVGEIEYNERLIGDMPKKKAAKYDELWDGYNKGSDVAHKRIIEIEKQRKLNDEELQKKLREALL